MYASLLTMDNSLPCDPNAFRIERRIMVCCLGNKRTDNKIKEESKDKNNNGNLKKSNTSYHV